MLQSPERLRFLLKTAEQFATCQAWFDDFQSYFAARLFLLSFVDNTHVPLAQVTKDSVFANAIGQPTLRTSRGSETMVINHAADETGRMAFDDHFGGHVQPVSFKQA